MPRECPAPIIAPASSMSWIEFLIRAEDTVYIHATIACFIYDVYLYFFHDRNAAARCRRERVLENVKAELLCIRREYRENIKYWFLNSIEEIDIRVELQISTVLSEKEIKAVGAWIGEMSRLVACDGVGKKGNGEKRDGGKWEVIKNEEKKITVELSEEECKVIQ
jgi:hypothetical protein